MRATVPFERRRWGISGPQEDPKNPKETENKPELGKIKGSGKQGFLKHCFPNPTRTRTLLPMPNEADFEKPNY